MKTKGVAKLKKEADKYFSKYIRLRDSYVVSDGTRYAQCITCKIPRPITSMQAGHFVSRKVNALRYVDMNVHAQCYSCNVMRYGEQFEYAKQINLLYGDNTAQMLHSRRFETHKFTTTELEEIIRQAKEQINTYENQ